MLNSKRLRALLLGLGAIFVLFLAVQVYQSFQHRGKVGVRVAVLPNDSILYVDSKKTKPGKIYMTKGSHTLLASRVDFGNDTKTINTADVTKNETIYMLPAANTPAAK